MGFFCPSLIISPQSTTHKDDNSHGPKKERGFLTFRNLNEEKRNEAKTHLFKNQQGLPFFSFDNIMQAPNVVTAQQLEAAITSLAAGQTVINTCYNKTAGELNRQGSAKGCIVSKGVLNKDRPITLAPLGQALFASYKQGNATLLRVLDRDMMALLESKLTATVAERNKIVEDKTKALNVKLGFLQAKKSAPCEHCGVDTCKTWSFGTNKRYRYCHRIKDGCIEARDAHYLRAQNALAAQGAAAPVKDKIVELVVSNKTAEAGKLHNISNDDLLAAIISTQNPKLKAGYEAEYERRTLLA